MLLRTALQDRIANLNGATVRHVLKQDLPAFRSLMVVSVAQSMASSVLAQSLKYLADSLALHWRKRATRVISRDYFGGIHLYLATHLGGLKDPDQRLIRDLDRLCGDVAQLIPNMVKPTIDVLWYGAYAEVPVVEPTTSMANRNSMTFSLSLSHSHSL